MRSYRGANSENMQPAQSATPRSSADAGALARRRAGRSTRDLEDRRRRHAAGRRPWRINPAVTKRSPTATTARRSAASSRSRSPEHSQSTPRPQRRVDHRRRALLRRASLRSRARGGEGLRSVLGVHRRPGARGHVCAGVLDATFGPEVRFCGAPRTCRRTARRMPGCSFSGCSRPIPDRYADRLDRQHRGSARLHPAARGGAVEAIRQGCRLISSRAAAVARPRCRRRLCARC